MMRAAWEFEKFLLSPGPMQDFFAATGNPVCVADLLTNPMYTGIIDEGGEQFRWQLEYTLKEGMLGDMTHVKAVEYMDFLQQAYLQIAYGKASPADALAEAEQKTNALLAE